MNEDKSFSFLSQIKSILFIVGIFFLNFLARIIISPLMPSIEKDLKIGHGEAGSLFLLISLGYCLGLLPSGFISSHIHHRRTILLSSIAIGMALMVVSISHHLWEMRVGLIFVGIGAGLYLPSGISIITELVQQKHLGKALALHELAPNLGFVTAPLLTEALLGFFPWRGVLLIVGISSLAAGVVFMFWGRGGAFPGEAPNFGTLRTILIEPSFWIMMMLFGLGIGASIGVYAMLPLYLVAERGMDRTLANTIIAFSRALTLSSSFLIGWVTDRIGPQRTLLGVFFTMGIATMLLGLVHGSWIILIVPIQSLLAASFFPPGFTALSRIGPQRIKNVIVSFTVPIGFLLGGGVIAAGIGIMGEMGSFSLGIAILGGFISLGVPLVRYLKLANE